MTIDLDSIQEVILTEPNLEVKWLFEFTLYAGGQAVAFQGDSDVTFGVGGGAIMTDDSSGYPATPTYRWSTTNCAYDGHNYTAKIKDFNFSKMTRAKSEFDLQAPSRCTFTVVNPNNALTPEDFDACKVMIRQVLSDGTNEDVFYEFLLTAKVTPQTVEETLKFDCVDYIYKFLKGTWPNSPLTSNEFPEEDNDYGNRDDGAIVPVVFGTAYIPLRAVFVSNDRRYLLGPSGPTYTVTKVRAPRKYGNSVWENGTYEFNQTTETGNTGGTYRCFQFVPTTGDSSSPPASPVTNGLWKGDGAWLEDALVKFSRSDTVSITNPADVLEYILVDMGIPRHLLDFSDAATTFDSSAWNLEWNHGFWKRIDRKELIANLLSQCHCAFDYCQGHITLRVLDTTSQATLTDADIKCNEQKHTTFDYSLFTKDVFYDCGDIAYQQTDEPIDQLTRFTVPAKINTNEYSGDLFEVPFVNDSVNAQKLGMLYYQWKYGRKAEITFVLGPHRTGLLPGELVTINDTKYGGLYEALIDSIEVNKDCSLKIEATIYKWTLDNFEDLAPQGLTLSQNGTMVVWQPLIVGSQSTVSSGSIPAVLPGILRVGSGQDYILLDPTMGIRMIHHLYGITLDIPIDGSTATIFHGYVKECEIQVYTSGVIKTSADPSGQDSDTDPGGMIINNNGIQGYTTAAILYFNLDLTTEEVTIGNESYAHCLIDGDGNLYFKIGNSEYLSIGSNGVSSLALTAGSDITMLADASDPAVIVWNDPNTDSALNMFSYLNAEFYIQAFYSDEITTSSLLYLHPWTGSTSQFLVALHDNDLDIYFFYTPSGSYGGIYPDSDDAVYLGTSSYPWDRVYALNCVFGGGSDNDYVTLRATARGATSSYYPLIVENSSESGLMYVRGDGYTYVYQDWDTSDERRKANIIPMQDSIKDKMRSITPKYHTMDLLPDKVIASITAQEWLKVGLDKAVREVIHPNGKSEYCTNSGVEIAYTVKYVQELHDEIKELREEIELLKAA